MNLDVLRFFDMEICIYRNFDDRAKGKRLFCSRVECMDTFDFNSAVSVFKSIYGACLIELLVI